MKKYLIILGGLVLFAVGFGVGREQGKESVLRSVHELRDEDFVRGIHTGYVEGALERAQCDDYTQDSFAVCDRVQKKLDEFEAETKKAETR